MVDGSLDELVENDFKFILAARQPAKQLKQVAQHLTKPFSKGFGPLEQVGPLGVLLQQLDRADSDLAWCLLTWPGAWFSAGRISTSAKLSA
ncbi:unnamed protein product [Lupinus luteus]|uniref:Uncharacterized protein n=1 Tax=Lupinus luteus TaxID=3873 RepID=A0AAV1W158_LUPLU